jgi:anti-sigma-K factor RskA
MLAGAYALDALDAAEAEQFERHLLECQECADEVRGLRETAAVLGMAVATTPPAALRANVMGEIARTPQLPPSAPPASGPVSEPLPAARPAPEPVRLPAQRRPLAAVNRAVALAAALAVLLAGGLGAVGWQRGRDAEQARQELAQALAIASAPDAERIAAPVAGGGTVTVVTSDGGSAVLASGLADPGEGKIYQLWINHPGEEDMRAAGLGPAGTAADETWTRVVQGMQPGDAFALSVEPEGGSAAPTTDPVVLVQT